MRLPRSSPSRRTPGFHRLLTSVDLYAPAGLQFSGQLLSPGAEFKVSDLPAPAVLLESAGSVRVAPQRSRYSFEHLWVLWRFDFPTEQWIEVVRMTATDASWTTHVAPIAYRLLHPVPIEPAEERAAPAAEQLATFIRVEISKLSRDVRCYVLAELDRCIAQEIVAATRELSVRPMAIGEGQRAYPRIGAHPSDEAGVLRPPFRL